MYMSGLSAFEDDASIDPAAAAVDPINGGAWSWPQLPSGAGVENINWTGAINTALQAWTSKNQADTQLEIAKINAQKSMLPYSTIPGYYGSASPRYSVPGLSPFPGYPGSVGGLDFSTLLIIGAVIAGGYFLLKD